MEIWANIKKFFDKLSCAACAYKAIAFMIMSYAAELVFQAATPYLPGLILSNPYVARFLVTYLTFLGIEVTNVMGMLPRLF